MIVQDFEDLRIYQDSRILAKKIYQITKCGGFRYDTRFVQQIRASAGSISDNIAEGFERQGNKEFKNFLFIAKGSCGELRAQINRAYDVDWIDEQSYLQLYAECKALAVGINRMIQSLKNSDYQGSRYSEQTQRTHSPNTPNLPNTPNS